ncbi:MAG: SPFH domain-containing protein [Candidatus Heimdallarchaeaceae archaeon]|jgi:regulator of protease activity HflC (stomatin/prohibitin superfamily)
MVNALVWVPVGVVIVAVLFLLFYASRYRKFTSDTYMIHFRNGKVIKAGIGGKAVVMPLIDEVRVIPVTTNSTFLEAKEKVLSREFQEISVTAFVFWRVIDPEVAFSRTSWDKSSVAYVENIIRNAAESIIRTTCANMALEKIIRDRQAIIEAVTKELHALTADWGLIIESCEIRDIEIIDPNLKANVSAIMKIEQEKLARLKSAEMQEVTQLRDLEVSRKVGIETQEVELDVESKEKDKEIKVQELERKRTEVEAHTYQTKIEIEADANAEQIRKLADAKQFEMVARARGEAAAIREAKMAEAEGILRRIEALAKADTRLFQEMIIEKLPEIYQNLEIDRMIVTGNKEDAFSTIANSILPFLQVVPELAKRTELQPKKKN